MNTTTMQIVSKQHEAAMDHKAHCERETRYAQTKLDEAKFAEREAGQRVVDLEQAIERLGQS